MNEELTKEAANENTSGSRLEELAEINEELAIIVAQNAATPPQLLVKLNYHDNQAIRKSIAKNPNTPIKLLWQLGFEFPEHLLSNPILILLLISSPNLVEEIPIETLIKLLKYKEVPDLWLDIASRKRNIKIAFSMLINSKTSIKHLVNILELFDEALDYPNNYEKDEYQNILDILFNINNHVNWEQQLEQGWQDEVTSNIIATHYTDINYKQYLIKILKTVIENLFQNIADDSHRLLVYKNVCHEVLQKLLLCSQQEKQQVLSIDKNLSLARKTIDINILNQLLTESDKHFKIKKAMLENPNLPQKILVEILDRLIKRTDCIRLISDCSICEVLKKAKIPSYFLEKMAQQKDNEWQLFVASHPNTPTSILEKYAQSSNKGIVSNVAKNPNTPKHILSKLAEHEWEIQYAVATNPNTPKQILRKLINDNSYFINSSLASNANLPIHDNIVYNPNTPTELLKEIALRAKDYRTRIRVAQHQNTNAEILEILAKDVDYEVRSNVAQNAKTSLNTLEKLAQDSHNEVRYAILANPNLTKNIFLRLIRKIYSRQNYSLGYLLVLLDTNVSPIFLEENADSLLWIERYIIAIHPQTPVNTLQRLTKDTNRYVRAAALERCQVIISHTKEN